MPRLRRPYPLTAPILALFALQPASHRPDRAQGPPILMISLAGLGADSGLPASLLPDALWFERAYAPTPLGQPNLATLLTGLNPPQHGVRGQLVQALDTGRITLADQLSTYGYHTAAFTQTASTRERWGLLQGFDQWTAHGAPDPRGDGRGPLLGVTEAALRAIATGPDEATYFWVHLGSTELSAEGSPRGPIALAETTEAVQRLVTSFRGRWPEGVVAVVGDGGPSAQDPAHRPYLLEDATLNVPLALAAPGLEPGRSDDPVGLVDLAPTLLHLAGVPAPPGLPGADLRAGGSEVIYHEALAGQMRLALSPLYGLTDPEGRYIEGSWSSYHVFEPDGRVSAEPQVRSRRGPLSVPAALTLAAMRADPPVAEQRVVLDPTWVRYTLARTDAGGDPSTRPGTRDPRDSRELFAWAADVRGQLDLGLRHRAETSWARLNFERPGTWEADWLRWTYLWADGQEEAARQVLVERYQRAPSGTIAVELAHAEERIGLFEAALAAWTEVLAQHPDLPEAIAGLARAHLALGQAEEAERLAASLTGLAPDHPETQVLQAELALAASPETAVELARTALARAPANLRVHLVLGQALDKLARQDEAIASLREAMMLDPYHQAPRVALARVVLERGHWRDAHRLVAPVLQRLPEHEAANEVARLATARQDELAEVPPWKWPRPTPWR